MAMTKSIQAVIAPGHTMTRVIVTEGAERTLLKAHLTARTGHPRALPYLLEALALWEGATVRAVLAVDEWDASCATTLDHDVFGDAGTPPLYTLEWVPLARARRSRMVSANALRLGNFRDLRRVLYNGSGR
jgi:hypothetical protein